MPAIYHEGSWLGNATDPEVLVKDTVGWTGKNLLKNTATTQTINGVTFTVNADGSVTANGTATANTVFPLNLAIKSKLEENGKYILSGCPSGGATNKYKLDFRTVTASSSTDAIYNDIGEGATFTLTNAQYSSYELGVTIRIENGQTVNNLTFYPMLRRADITDPTYEPYHESVEEEIEQIYADNGVLGAKNLLPINATSQTINGVTFTVNEDGSVSTSGTSTASVWFNINGGIAGSQAFINSLKKGVPYIYSGTPSNAPSGVQMIIWDANHLCPPVNAGQEQVFSIASDYVQGNRTNLSIGCSSAGVSFDNLVFKPMIRLASDPDDTYQPYAMTNRELTEEVSNIKSVNAVGTITANSNLDDYYKTGDYYSNTASNTSTLVNKPSDLTGAFRLSVICAGYPIGEGSNASNVPITQKIELVNGATPAIYMRHKTGGSNTYGSWYKFTGTVVS